MTKPFLILSVVTVAATLHAQTSTTAVTKAPTVDQILSLSWKVLMPSTLLLLVSTAIVVVWRAGV